MCKHRVGNVMKSDDESFEIGKTREERRHSDSGGELPARKWLELLRANLRTQDDKKEVEQMLKILLVTTMKGRHWIE